MTRTSMAFKHFDINKDYSGKLVIRMDPDTHKEVARIASDRGVSINLLLNFIVKAYINEEN